MIKAKYIPLMLMVGMTLLGAAIWWISTPPQVPISPLASPQPTPSPTQTPMPLEKKPAKSTVRGRASYYSRAGCLGCSKDFTMANGEALDDNKLTLAYNYGKLNVHVSITNVKTGATVVAKVSDRGGFERHGKIADLSLATKNALGCGDVCEIELVP